MFEQRFQFGIEVIDVFSGFRGIITGFCTYITGCDQYLVQPKIKKDGTIMDSRWIDVDRLKTVKGVKRIKLPKETTNGADIPALIR